MRDIWIKSLRRQNWEPSQTAPLDRNTKWDVVDFPKNNLKSYIQSESLGRRMIAIIPEIQLESLMIICGDASKTTFRLKMANQMMGPSSFI